MYHSTPFMNLPQQGVQDENSAYSGMDFSCMQQQMVQPGLNSSYSSFGSSAHSNVTTPSTNDSGISHGSEEKGEEALFHVPSRLNHIRKAKTKEVGKELREKLRLHGLEVTSGRRKGMNTTAFTCLVEEEAQRLGLDLKHIVREYFPAKPLSHLAYRRSTNQPFEERKRDLEGAV
uniref:TF_AP-2 domain-containing protein n=1 Tax=Heterorhabditis bacteriophora TaxID=37862 RepID=A0A1I7XGW7_HETBA